MTDFERRCRRLLRAYPADYRAERGDEIVDTLIEAHPDRTRPTVRDAVALVVGGFRVRTTENRKLPLRTNLRLAVMFGAAFYLAPLAVQAATHMAGVQQHGVGKVAYIVSMASVLVVLVAAWCGRRAWTIAPAAFTLVALAVLAMAQVRDATPWGDRAYAFFTYAENLQLAIPVIAIALLIRRSPRLPWTWLLLMAPFIVREAIPYDAGALNAVLSALSIGQLLLILAWTAIDARPALGLAIFLLYATVTDTAITYGSGGSSSPPFNYTFVLIALGAVLFAALRMRTWKRRRV